MNDDVHISLNSFSYPYWSSSPTSVLISGHSSGEKWIIHSMSDTVLSLLMVINSCNSSNNPMALVPLWSLSYRWGGETQRGGLTFPRSLSLGWTKIKLGPSGSRANAFNCLLYHMLSREIFAPSRYRSIVQHAYYVKCRGGTGKAQLSRVWTDE